jgi:hypothetical protein
MPKNEPQEDVPRARRAVRDGGDGVKTAPFFLIGAQRSGTTLLRLILNAHSQIAIPEEGTFLIPLLNKKNLHRPISGSELSALASYLSLNPQLKLWACDLEGYLAELAGRESITLGRLVEDLYSACAQQNGKSMWGDKTPPFFRKVDIFHSLFPEARFIHIVRDGRDVFDSWRKIDRTKGNVSTIALDWRYKLSRIERSFSKIPESCKMTLRYEDLLQRTEESVRLVCRFLKIDFQEGMLEFYRSSHKYIGKHHSKLIFRPVNSGNVEKWKKNLTPREARSFALLAGRYLRKYGYQTPSGGSRLSDLLWTAANLLVGVPKRGWEVLRVKQSYQTALRHGTSSGVEDVGEPPQETAARDDRQRKEPGA